MEFKGRLMFKNSKGQRLFISEVETTEEAFKKAYEDLKVRAPHFKSYYTRVWTNPDGEYWMDVGDHVCFYLVEPNT